VGTIRAVRQMLVAAARRHARVRDEAEDLAHDIVLAALRRGLALDSDSFGRAADASALRHGAFVARSAARRRARELLYALDLEPTDTDPPNGSDGAPSTQLPSALHTTLLLLSLGHTKSELRSALGLTDVALRKRLQGLRQRAPLARPQFTKPSARSPALRRSQVAVLPQLAARRDKGGHPRRLIALSDGEGHGIIFSEVLTNARGAATSNASEPHPPGNEAPDQGKPC
jgi:DNA-directed RNA polymerase specialized sigma24 family protein